MDGLPHDAWWRRPAVRARAADAVYVLIGLVATLGTASSASELTGRTLLAPGVLACLLATVALLWRRRYPLRVVALAVPSALLTGQFLLVFVALGALAIRRRDRLLWLLVGLTYVAAVVGGVVTGGGVVDSAISTLFGLGLAVAAGAYLGARRDLLASLRARADQAEAELALRADQARLAERTRIAQEMHDVLAHRISLIGLHAGGLEVQPDAGPEVVERSAALIRETARAALEDLRGVLGVLRADASPDAADLAPQPQLGDLPRLVASSATAGVGVTLVDELPDEPLPELTGRTVYRVVQEALTNVHKHARDAATTVRLTGKPRDGLVVEVVNVRPVSADTLLPGAGVGLVGLGERVGLAGGSLDAGPTADGGWRLRAWFPWPT